MNNQSDPPNQSNTFQEPQPSFQPEPPKKFSLPAWASILIAAVAIIVISLAGWAAYRAFVSRPTELPNESPEGKQVSPLPAAGEIAPADETTNWQTYQNEEYGFEIKYPKEWVIQRVNSQTGADDAKGEKIILWSKKNYKDFIPYLGTEGIKEGIFSFIIQYKDSSRSAYLNDPEIKLISSESIIIDNIKGTKNKFRSSYGEWTAIYLDKNGIIYSLVIPDKNQEQKDIANKIFSTFKFMEPTLWENITEEELKQGQFEIKTVQLSPRVIKSLDLNECIRESNYRLEPINGEFFDVFDKQLILKIDDKEKIIIPSLLKFFQTNKNTNPQDIKIKCQLITLSSEFFFPKENDKLLFLTGASYNGQSFYNPQIYSLNIKTRQLLKLNTASKYIHFSGYSEGQYFIISDKRKVITFSEIEQPEKIYLVDLENDTAKIFYILKENQTFNKTRIMLGMASGGATYNYSYNEGKLKVSVYDETITEDGEKIDSPLFNKEVAEFKFLFNKEFNID